MTIARMRAQSACRRKHPFRSHAATLPPISSQGAFRRACAEKSREDAPANGTRARISRKKGARARVFTADWAHFLPPALPFVMKPSSC